VNSNFRTVVRRAWLAVALLCLVNGLPAFASAVSASSPGDFSGWHLPLPAGEWQISRGPCASGAHFTHTCGYYEERCAVDLVPLTGSMEDVPVLAPQAGQVFFLGTRSDAGLMLMLLHPDGRVSGYMHLARVVVGLDEKVAQGQVVAYAGSTGSSGNPHLHFFVQPDAVERECTDLKGLDDLNYVTLRATSRNLAWTKLTLPNPPAGRPDWITPLMASTAPGSISTPERLVLAPGVATRFPVAVRDSGTITPTLNVNGLILLPVLHAANTSAFSVLLTAPGQSGDYELTLRAASGPEARVRYSVRPLPDTSASSGLLFVNPSYLSPSGWSSIASGTPLCWGYADKSAQRPIQFRVVVAGPAPADSGWITGTCWQPLRLKPGTYYWKVFVRDARGYMNRTNQRPYAFVVGGK
jgi:peptidase M23-like protein